VSVSAGLGSSLALASLTQLRKADSVRSRSLATWGRGLVPARTRRTASALNSGVKLRLFLRSMDTSSLGFDSAGVSTELGQAHPSLGPF